eukprot:gene9642-1846_t
MQRIDSEYVSRENEKVLKKLADAFVIKTNSTGDDSPQDATLFVDFFGDSGDFHYSTDSKKDIKDLYHGIMKRFAFHSRQSIFVAGQDDSKRRADFLMILDTLLKEAPFLKNMDKVIPLKKIFHFLSQFWITTDTEELQCHSSIKIAFEKKNDQEVLQAISFHFLFGKLEHLINGVNNSYKIFEYILTSEFDEVMDLFFQEDEKNLILDIFQAIIQLERVNNVKEVEINPSENFRPVQKYLHMTDEQFYEWVLCIRAVKLDSWKLNIQEFQNQLYHMIFEVILSKVNRFLEKVSEDLEEKNLKILTFTNIWNIKNDPKEANTSWNDFFVNFSIDFWKINIFDISNQEFYLEGIRKERLSSFIDLVDRDNHDVFSVYSTNETFVKENVIKESLTNYFPNDSILKIKEEGFKLNYPFSMNSVHYNLPLVHQKQRYWKFVESTLKQNVKHTDYFFRYYNDLDDFKSLISGENDYIISFINASENVKDQVNLLGVQYLKSLNFSLVSPRRQSIRNFKPVSGNKTRNQDDRQSLFVQEKFQSPKSLFEKFLDSESDLFANYVQSIESAKSSFREHQKKMQNSIDKENEESNLLENQQSIGSLNEEDMKPKPPSTTPELKVGTIDSSSSIFADKENMSTKKIQLIEREDVPKVLVERTDSKLSTSKKERISKMNQDFQNPENITLVESTPCIELDREEEDDEEPYEEIKYETPKSEVFWLFEFISQIETYSFVIKQDFTLFSLSYTQKFLELSKNFFLSEIKLTKLYLNIGSFSATKILNTHAVSKIISVFEQIFQFSIESWMYFVQSGVMDYLSILLQNYTQSLKFEENNLFLFQDDEKEKKKYLRSVEDHFIVINHILKFFDLITRKFSSEHCHKQMSIFHSWFENSGKIAISTMIDISNQACEGIKQNQGKDAYQTVLINLLKTLLNLGKSESLFLYLYDENLALTLAHYFSELFDYPEIQILVMRLSARLCKKTLMMNYFVKHGLISQIVRSIGTSTSPHYIKACVEVIVFFSRQPQFSDEYTESFAYLVAYRFHDEDEENFPSQSFNENMTIQQRILQMRCLTVKMISYVFNLQSKAGKSDFEIQYFSNKNTTKFVNVFCKTLTQKIGFNQEILQSIQFLDVEDFNFETKIKFIAELFKNLDSLEKERVKLKILKYMHAHKLPMVGGNVENKSVLEIDQYAMFI